MNFEESQPNNFKYRRIFFFGLIDANRAFCVLEGLYYKKISFLHIDFMKDL